MLRINWNPIDAVTPRSVHVKQALCVFIYAGRPAHQLLEVYVFFQEIRTSRGQNMFQYAFVSAFYGILYMTKYMTLVPLDSIPVDRPPLERTGETVVEKTAGIFQRAQICERPVGTGHDMCFTALILDVF